jgi:hypothetical protein
MTTAKPCPPIPSEEHVQKLYNWIDGIPLSRPKRNISRDFSDGVLLAEVIHHVHPTFVELHNYSGAHSLSQKLYNWNTMNAKVLKRLGIQLSHRDVEDCANAVPGAVEKVLLIVKHELEKPKNYKRPLSVRSSASGTTPTGQSKDEIIEELRGLIREKDETISILNQKCLKMEQLISIKDKKIENLRNSN